MSRPGPVAHVLREEDWQGERWYFELRKASGTVLHKEGPFRGTKAPSCAKWQSRRGRNW
jgi:hypothetical protein